MKKGISKKTIEKMQKAMGKPATENDMVVHLQKQIEDQNKKIQDLTDILIKKKDPSIFRHHDSKVTLEDLDTVYLLEPRERRTAEKQKADIERELKGLHKLLGEVCGGRHKAYEYSTGDKSALKERGKGLVRQEVYNTPPKFSEVQKAGLKREYDDLTEELRRLVPSYKSQWDQKSSHHQEAVNKELALITTHSKKVTRWQNIAKILDPTNEAGWDLSRLRRK